MKQILLINKVLWKQYLYKHRTWLLLMMIVAIALRFGQTDVQEERFAGILVGVCALDKDGEELLARLRGQNRESESGESVFRFCPYEEQELMLRDVTNGTLECGYVLPEDFFENLSEGKMRNQITLYYSTSSGAHKLSYEMVFSHLFGMLSEEVLTDWFSESGMEDATGKAEGVKQLLEWKEMYENGDATFSFIFEHVGAKSGQETAVLDTMRGLVGVVIFFLALLGLANCCELSGKAGAFAKHEARRIEWFSLHIAVMGSVLTGGLFLLLAGAGTGTVKELLGLGIYFVILEAHLWVLKWILRTKEVVYGAIPVLLLGSILLCPVFFRAETFLPALGYLGKVFPVYWYLNFFA